MFPYTFELVTALTITVIGVILVLYFIVLKRKGWLTENPNESNKSHYLCPNQECRKIFQKPVALTDLSQTPPRPYSACPHCGFALKKTSPSTVGKKTMLTLKTPRSPEDPVRAQPTVAKNIQERPTSSSKSLQARPPECSHFFGYLRKIPKNTSMPDECFSCLKMVECISYNVSEQTMSK